MDEWINPPPVHPSVRQSVQRTAQHIIHADTRHDTTHRVCVCVVYIYRREMESLFELFLLKCSLDIEHYSSLIVIVINAFYSTFTIVTQN